MNIYNTLRLAFNSVYRIKFNLSIWIKFESLKKLFMKKICLKRNVYVNVLLNDYSLKHTKTVVILLIMLIIEKKLLT